MASGDIDDVRTREQVTKPGASAAASTGLRRTIAPILALALAACSAGASTDAKDDTDTIGDTDAIDDTDMIDDTDPAPTCTDRIHNGTESDVDCGGGCPVCSRGDACVAHADCATNACVLQVCERAVVFSGTAKANGAVVGQYAATQHIVRLDFTAAPAAHDADGQPIILPVSSGEYVEMDLTPVSADRRVVVGDVTLDDPTGFTQYQAISPDYFGVVLELDDAESATSSATALAAAGLDGRAIEIFVVDTAP